MNHSYDTEQVSIISDIKYRESIKKKIPAKLAIAKKPLHGGVGGWKAKARAVCCGNFEPGPVGKDIEYRAEVLIIFEMRTALFFEGYCRRYMNRLLPGVLKNNQSKTYFQTILKSLLPT